MRLLQDKVIQFLREKTLAGKLVILFHSLTVLCLFWELVNLLLMALVFLALSSLGNFPFFLVEDLTWDLAFSLRTVKYLAIYFLTTFILPNLVAVPPATLETLRVESSYLRLFNWVVKELASWSLSLKTLNFLSAIFTNSLIRFFYFLY